MPPANPNDPSVRNWQQIHANLLFPPGGQVPPPLPEQIPAPAWGAEPVPAPKVDPSVPPLPQVSGPPMTGTPPPMPQGNFGTPAPLAQAGAATPPPLPAAPPSPPPMPSPMGVPGDLPPVGAGVAAPGTPGTPLPGFMNGVGQAAQNFPNSAAGMNDPALKVIRDIAKAKWGAKLGDQTKNPRDMQIPNQGGGITVPGPGGLGATMLVPVTHPDGTVEMVQVDNPDMKAPPTELGALGHMSPEGVKQLMQGQLQKGVTAGMNQMQPMSPNEALAQSIQDWKKQAGIMSPDEKAHSLQMQSQESKQASGEKVAGMEIAGKEKVATIEAESKRYETMARSGMGIQQLADKFIADRVAKGLDTTPEQLKAFTDTMAGITKDTQQELHGGTPPIPVKPGGPVSGTGPPIPQLGLGANAPGQIPAQSGQVPPPITPTDAGGMGTLPPQGQLDAAAAKRKADMDAINAIGTSPAVRQVLQEVTKATIDQSGNYVGGQWQHEPGFFGANPSASSLISAVQRNQKLLQNPAMLDALVQRISNMPGAPTKEQLLDQLSRAVGNRLLTSGAQGEVPLGTSGITYGLGGPRVQRGGNVDSQRMMPGATTVSYPVLGTTTYAAPRNPFATGGLLNQFPIWNQQGLNLASQEAQGAGTALLQAILKLGPRAPGQQ